MILVVGLNPALDLTYDVDHLTSGCSHRVSAVHTRGGGKGGNVARILRLLGVDVLLTGFVGGSDGAVMEADFAAADVATAFLPIAGDTRRTVTVVDDTGATVLNEPGPRIETQEWAGFVDEFGSRVQQADAVVLTGSVPAGVPVTAYATLAARARAAGVPVLMDAAGEVLARSPAVDVVKPNAAEAAEITGEQLNGRGAVVRAARQLCAAGAGAAVISCGTDGLIAVVGDHTWAAYLDEPISGGNPTGAGDALAATLALAVRSARDADPARLPTDLDWPAVLTVGVATSAAAVVNPVAGDVDVDLAQRWVSRVVVESVT